jgi:excisionase family DNA binding protein
MTAVANDNLPHVLNADEVAELLRVDRKTVYDFAGRGVIPHQRLGRRLLFSRAAVMAWLESSCSKRSSNGGSG